MFTNNQIKLANLSMLEFMASKLGYLCDEVVFLGGCTTAIFISDLGAPDVRSTLDVDCVVDVISISQYYKLENKLLKQGFKKSIQDDVLCRWKYDELVLDVMPTDPSILGFGNIWYKSAIQHSIKYVINNQFNIKVVSAPYFLATKLEAFKTRGKMDYFASHDFEDIISVLDGRIEIVEEIIQSDNVLKKYLQNTFFDMSKSILFQDALPGHFSPYGNLAKDRIKLLKEKIQLIVKS